MSVLGKSPKALGRGALIAGVLSGVFLGLVVLTSPVVAAVVIVPASVAAGALLERSVPRAVPHSLVDPSFEPGAVIDAPRLDQGPSSGSATPAA